MKKTCGRCRITDERVLITHHRLPKSWGGDDNTSNLQVLCRNCHSIIHKELSQNSGKNTVKTLDDGRIEIMFSKGLKADNSKLLFLALGYHKGSKLIERNGFIVGVQCFPNVWHRLMEDFGTSKRLKKEFRDTIQ